MKLTDNVIAIYDIDLDESIKEFKKEFNEISKQSDPTGTHTFTFSKYDNNTVTTEIFYCSFYKKTVLIYSSQLALQLKIKAKSPENPDDTSLEYEIGGGDVFPVGGSFIELLADEKKSPAYYIGRYDKTQDISSIVSNLINNNIHELKSLTLDSDISKTIIDKGHEDITLLDTYTLENMYYDIYTIPCNSTFKINQVDGVEGYEHPDAVDVVIVVGNPSLLYLGDCCNEKGFYYSMYTLNKIDELNEAKYIVENELLSTENLVIDTTELVDIAVDYFNERMNQYKTDINTAFEKEELPTNVDDNPFANRLYDVERGVNQSEPLKMTKRLGGE